MPYRVRLVISAIIKARFVAKMCNCIRGRDSLWDSIVEFQFRHVDNDRLIERVVGEMLGKVDRQMIADNNGCFLSLPLWYRF